MRFQPTADQRAIQAAIRDLCERRDGHPSWPELRDVGVFGLRRPEQRGGAGLGLTETALVFEELGRALVPGPLIGTHLAATHLGPEAVGLAVGVVDRADRPVLVEHFDALDALLVFADDGVWRVELDALDARPVAAPLDPLTPLHLVPELPRGERVAAPDQAARWRLEGGALAAALQLGIAGRVVERATAYAKQRTQFGRPIGSFQALKHLIADMLVHAEVARAAVYAAAVTLDDPQAAAGDVLAAVATAKLLADAAAGANAKANLQVHGGIGFTWESDVHLYLKRSWVLATCFGTADDHSAALAELL